MAILTRATGQDFDLLENMTEAVLGDDRSAFSALWASAPFEDDPELRQRLRVLARLVSRSATAQTRLIRRRERADYVKDVVDRLVSGPFDETTDRGYGADCAEWAYFGRPQEQLRQDVYVQTQICVSGYVLFLEGGINWPRLFAGVRRSGRRRLAI